MASLTQIALARLMALTALPLTFLALPAVAGPCGIVEQHCSAGAATVSIDGMQVARPCWKKTIFYACIDAATTDTCATIDSKRCELDRATCQQGVTIDGIFQCITEQREYRCKVAAGATTTTSNCAGQQFCIEGNCYDTGSAPDPDFAKAVAGLEVAREAGVYVDDTTFQVFKGQDNRCSKSVLKNCCKSASSSTNGLTNLAIIGGSAYAFDVLSGSGMKSTLLAGFDPTAFALAIAALVVQQMLACDKSEVLVAVKRDHRLCHYVGDYCSRKIHLLVASICVQHKETYCCYNSKIARILNEAARSQLPATGWGGPEHPACQGLSIAQFQALDLSRVDFSDVYADVKPAAADEKAIREQAAEKVNSYFGR